MSSPKQSQQTILKKIDAIPSREVSCPDESKIVGGGKDGIRIFKLVKVETDSDGNQHLVPLYINNGLRKSPKEEWKVGVWYESGVGEHIVEVNPVTGEEKFGKVTASLGNGLSFRPGFHSGADVPYAPHIYERRESFEEYDIDGSGRGKLEYNKIRNIEERRAYRNAFPYHKTRLQPHDTAWVECLITYDEKDQQKVGKNGLQTLPEFGYKWRTNTSANSDVEWYISRYVNHPSINEVA